jgi:ribosome biogenesis GTPase
MLMTERLDGLVLRAESGHYQVLTSKGRIITARIAKKVKVGPRAATNLAVIGDHVQIRMSTEGAVIEQICERRNELARLAPGSRTMKDVLAANLDMVVVVHSLHEPEFNAARLDRLLAIAEQAEIPAIVVLSKTDLASADEIKRWATLYRGIGYPVITTSIYTGEGIEAVQQAIRDKISAVVGPSGVGKSSLLNALQPGLRLRTAEISEATGKGRHTTVASELLPLDVGGYIADTPGLRSIALVDVVPEEVEWFFREFRPYLGTCRFTNCLHEEELGCAIHTAVERGEISPSRYQSYRRLLDEVRESVAYAL